MQFRARIHTLLPLLLIAGAAPALTAQSPDDRQALLRFRDSLTAARDTISLVKLENKMIESAKKNRKDAVLHLRLGLLANRIAALGGKKHVDYAISEFEWAQELQPDWPWSQYGIGLAEQLDRDRAGGFSGGLFTMLAIDAMSKADKAFEASLAIDSNFTPTVMGLAEVALKKHIEPPVALALPALRRAAERDGTPEVFMTLGNLERRYGSPDSALAAFVKAGVAGEKSALVDLELARTIPLAHREVLEKYHVPGKDTLYFRGASSDDPVVDAMYRADLEPIVSDTVIAHFDSLHGNARVEWLRTFWQDRDDLELRESGARLAEHFRRWAYVRSHFSLAPYARLYSVAIESYESHDKEIDDRGIVYLRHGAPADRKIWNRIGDLGVGFIPPNMFNAAIVVPAGSTTAQRPLAMNRPPDGAMEYGSETWLYQQPDGDVVLHFSAHKDPDDYRLQNSVFSLPREFMDYTVRGSKISGQLVANQFGDMSKVNEDRMRGKRDNLTATTTDSWTRTYPSLIAGKASWFAAGRINGQPLVHLIYGINSTPVLNQPWKNIPVTLRAIFLDSNNKMVGRMDSTVLVPKLDKSTKAIAVRAETMLPPGAIRARLSVEITPEIGSLMRTDTIAVPVVSGAQLDLSDVLIGRSGHSLRWNAAPDLPIWIDPRGASYVPTDTLHVFAEAYGLKTGEPYRVSISLKKKSILGKILGGNASINFTESITFNTVVGDLSRSILLSTLDSGSYVLDVTFEGPNGSVKRSRDLTIRRK